MTDNNLTYKLESGEGHALYLNILDFLVMSDDPAYNRIVRIRKAIDKVVWTPDKDKLKELFNKEFSVTGFLTNKTAWEYYQNYE